MKVVDKLNKKNHRRDLWVDADGVAWFFDWDTQDWRVLTQDLDIFDADSWTKQALGYSIEDTEDCKGWPTGPFTRILKGTRA